MDWALEFIDRALEDTLEEPVEVEELVVSTVLLLLLVGAVEETGVELVHGPQTVTVTVTGQPPVLEALLELDVCKSANVEEALPITFPRGSTLCLAARGVAATSPRREGSMMVERMAMRTCEDSSGEKPLLESVFALSVLYFWCFRSVLSFWYRRSKTPRLMDLEAADYVMSESKGQQGLVGTSYRLQRPYSTADTRAPLPALGGKTLLAESRQSRGRVVEKSNGIETERRCQKQEAWKHVRGHVPSGTTGVNPYWENISIHSPHTFQFQELKAAVKAGGVGVWSNRAYAISLARHNANPKIKVCHTNYLGC